MKLKYTPIYLSAGKGKYTRSNFGMDGTGYIHQQDNRALRPIISNTRGTVTMSARLLKSKLGSQFEEAAKAQLKKNQNELSTKSEPVMDMQKIDPAVVAVKTQGGKFVAERIESADNANAGKIYNVTLNNTTGAAVKVALGDGMGLVAANQGLPALPAGFIVGGNFGTGAVAQLKNWAQNKPILVKGMQVTVGQASTYSTRLMSRQRVDVEDTLIENSPINFQEGQDGSQLNPLLRWYGDFKFMFTKDNALLVVVPAGEFVNITFTVESVANATIQEMV